MFFKQVFVSTTVSALVFSILVVMWITTTSQTTVAPIPTCQPPIEMTLSARVFDRNTRQPIRNATISIVQMTRDTCDGGSLRVLPSQLRSSNNDGYIERIVYASPESEFVIEVNAFGYQPYRKRLKMESGVKPLTFYLYPPTPRPPTSTTNSFGPTAEFRPTSSH